MHRKIAVFTGTRAEYGLLFWLMKDIQADPELELQIIVSAMHLAPEFGNTWQQIVDDGFNIDAKVEMLLSSDTRTGVAKSIGLGNIGFADALARLAPDVLVVLGDRFEALSIVQTALIMEIPVAHLHGGEITEGAFDDAIRHAISKMSYLHFTATTQYRQRVIQLGESPERVFNVGAFGLDHLLRSPKMSKSALCESLGFNLSDQYFLVTYHPVTLGQEQPQAAMEALLKALDAFPDHQVVITYPNADNGGRGIIPIIEQYAQARPRRVLALASLGFKRYLSTLAGASAVIGNSSSGIIEAPSFGVPTVNVGNRQTGRLKADSVLDCQANEHSIRAAIQLALSESTQTMAKSVNNPYGSGNAAKSTLEILKTVRLDTLKRFHDLGGTA